MNLKLELSQDDVRILIGAIKWYGQEDSVDLEDKLKARKLARLMEQDLLSKNI
jgi:hypothetical protein